MTHPEAPLTWRNAIAPVLLLALFGFSALGTVDAIGEVVSYWNLAGLAAIALVVYGGVSLFNYWVHHHRKSS